MKQRLFLSLLTILALIYFALPRLLFHGGTEAVLFSWVWLGFVLMAFGGNLSGLMYGSITERKNRGEVGRSEDQSYRKGTGV